MTVEGTLGADGKTPEGTGTSKTDGKTDLATLPADIQTLISDLREEAKGYRIEKENLETKVTELTEDVETAQAASRELSEKVETSDRALTIRDLRETYSLDKRAEKFLTGKTPEELEEQAKELSTFVTPPKTTTTDEDSTGSAGGLQRETDPAQQGAESVDEDAARVTAFFG